MSIIYDALKKVEKANLGLKVETAKDANLKPKIIILYCVVACAGIFIGNLFFVFLTSSKKTFTKKRDIITQPQELHKETVPQTNEAVSLEEASSSAPVQIKQDLPQETLVLNGVFFSGNEKYALINNQIVKEGDVIDGTTVKQIGLEAVELETAGSTIRLSKP